MKRNLKLYLQDIWESTLAIEEYTQNLTEDEFYSNRQVQDAIVRRLEIIGEAVKNIDDDFRNKYPQIPWKKIAGMRDIIAHEYFGVKLERVWDVLRKDLPDIKQQMLLIMEREDV
ncbi:MAG: hypothetical protein COZ07_06880 [Candidatus Infernicultor aquiphilus]|uniref:DUF86 domain-containing protein n=1 Tax=Candidatus Infernicultor aquiphilus TaxID=1805029 RepID=A0A1J5GGP1_9BACT|nr:DUF86 domain-containing protein [bacterium]OIP67062.1 MAG: hypothetical protein AUK42_07185 [Candidatus Atribacteria bacterium CG2_30_33_13]PIU25784.1 MAG: hypothetical protein COT11_00940 [Candidatus Atribacteria bacterium CG08_land_8_20_14_0_20_33_29]PIW11898.1 MAG: hypothetical protein COW35_04450 [Candidatus Atribacteria bacterium CG17_big_fil_post_rev_8_21_14_2_50_34_11]PIX33512.1 MAG: hypothetical protein COZ58_07370 [Candidatus Atribacteria bacterium CG_4_8_14_3_um_filter_34_18]PIY32